MLLILIIISFILAFIIPNAFARLTILLSIAEGILDSNNENKNSNFTKAIMLTVTYAPYIVIITVITASGGAIYAVALFSEILNYEWSYFYWMLLMVPGSILSLLSLWILLLFLYPVKNDVLKEQKEYFSLEKKKLGSISVKGYKLIALYIILILLWLTTSYHSLSIPLVSVIVMILLFIPGINLMNWKEALQTIDWGVPILFATGLTIAKAFEKSGVLKVISSFSISFASEKPVILIVLLISLFLILIRLFFTNFNAVVATFFPIILIISQNLDINQIWLGMVALSSMSMAYILPTQAIGFMVMISKKYYRTIDLFKVGIPLTLLNTSIYLILAYVYWPILGLSH